LDLRFIEEERDEVAVLPLGDAITDGAGIARHLEVLAERFGQLLAGRLGQIKDAAVSLADLLRGEGSQAWISVRRCPVTLDVSQGERLFWRWVFCPLLRASLPSNALIELVVRLSSLNRTRLYSPSLDRHRNTQQHRQHQAGGFGQIAGLISPGLAAELGPGNVHHRDLQLRAALLLAQMGRPADAQAEGGAG
jgi:hypothetical protein